MIEVFRKSVIALLVVSICSLPSFLGASYLWRVVFKGVAGVTLALYPPSPRFALWLLFLSSKGSKLVMGAELVKLQPPYIYL